MAPPTKSFKFDYSKGVASVQDGHTYYLPNSDRVVILPSHGRSTEFGQDILSASMFQQPVRWSESYGWMSFIPLSPLFISLPFEPLCWMPRIVEITIDVEASSGRPEKRFVMKAKDVDAWMKIDAKISKAAMDLRIFFGIRGSPPPLPSKFG